MALAVALIMVRAAEKRCSMAPPTALENLCNSVRLWPTLGALLIFESGWVAYQIVAPHSGWSVFDPLPCFFLQRANLFASAGILTIAARARLARERRERHYRQRIAHWMRDVDALAMDLASTSRRTRHAPFLQ